MFSPGGIGHIQSHTHLGQAMSCMHGQSTRRNAFENGIPEPEPDVMLRRSSHVADPALRPRSSQLRCPKP